MLTRIAVGFNNPIGIDHHEPTNQVVLSVHYASGRPHNFELVAPDGTRTKFSDISGLTEEVKIACVRSGPNQGGFVVGEMFTGTGAGGVIARISPDGGSIQNPWVRLPGEHGLMRGSLFQDRYGVFGGDLIAVTTAGGVWRIDSAGQATRLAQINTHLEGVTTVPDEPARYGPWAGKILIGAEDQGRIYTVSAAGSVTSYAIGVAPEDIEIIPENQNFYGVDYGGRTLWGAPASAFADLVGDVLVAQESPGILWHVRWDPASGKFQKKSLAQVPQWEHVAFSPAGLLTIPPVPDTRDPCPSAPPQPGPAATGLAWLGPRAVLCERPLRVSARLADAADRPLSGRTLTFSAAGLSAAAATDAGGIARAVLEPGHVASPLPLLVSFAGAPELLPSSVQAQVEIQPADSSLSYTGRSLLALGVAQEVGARLTDALDGRPLQGRAVAFQVGPQAARATTGADGLATTAIIIPAGEHPAEVVISFAGDPCHRPASARAPIVAYLPTSFVVWGGNPQPPAIGERVNFWGAQWARQVAGGDYDAHAEFKGYASLAGVPAVCQPAARTAGTPPLGPPCWISKPGQSGPPAPPLPEHVGVIVATSIAKDRSTIYGNVAAVVVVRVDPDPAYGAVPGKPGFGTIVGAVADGAGLFPQPPALLATQAQPPAALPGEAFDVTTEIANPSNEAAAGVSVEQRFDGVTPAAATLDAGALGAGARKTVATRVRAATLGARLEDESSTAYGARLEAADGRDLRSASTIAFRDAAGRSCPPVLAASSSRLRLPRLAATLRGTPCLGPGSQVAYELGAANVGSAEAAGGTGRLRFPDGSWAETALGGLAVGATGRAAFQWQVPAIPAKGAAEPPQAYEARLADEDQRPLTALAELRWQDALGNEYGAVEQPFASTLRLPIVGTAPQDPAPLLPGARTALVYTTQNRGSGNAFAVRVRVTGADGAVAACAPFSLRGSSEPVPVQVAASAPAVASRQPGEQDADYLARLRSADGAPLDFRHALTWEDASGAVYGPVEGSVAGTRILPVLALSLQGPEAAQSGDAIGYTATVANLGRADAGSVIVHFTLPDGSTRDVQLPALAAGATGRAPAAYTIPASQATGTITGRASLTWRDAVPNAYGPLAAAAPTRVTHRNQAPQVSAGPDQTIVLPAGARLHGAVTDDADPLGAPLALAWSKASGPGEAAFADPGKAATTASFSAPGTYVLRLTASDSELTGRDEVTVVVRPALQANQPPVVRAGADRTVTLPEELALAGEVTDDGLPAGGALTSVWTQVSGPALATFADPHAPATTVTFGQPGAYVLRLAASDSALVASDEVAVTVNPAVPLNQPPEVEAGPDETTSVAATIELRGDVADDGRPVGADLIVQWSVASGPGAAVFGSPGHAITPVTFGEAGTYVLRLTASDGQFTASDEVTITVTPAMQVNQPPVVDAGAARTIQLPAGADLAATVLDDGLPRGGVLALAWSVVSGPGEVAFVDPGSATTTARFGLAGVYLLRFTADDGEYRASDEVTVTVEPAPVLNDAPVVDAGPDQALTLPAAATLGGRVTDDGVPEGGALTQRWSVVSGPGPVAFADRARAATTAAFVDPGTYVLRLSASDSQLTSSDDVTVAAGAPAGAQPTVSLATPADGAEVTTFADVVGSVSGGVWKLEYRLDGAAAAAAPWTVFASGSGAVGNAKLGVFDPTMLLNGTYAIRLTATAAGGSASAARSVVVAGALKLGNFTLSFVDLEVPMIGLPIQVIRSYDSRDQRKGDFGVGWTLGLKDVRLEKSAVPGMHWEQTVSGRTIQSYCLQPTRPLTVTVTFPDGRVYRFQAKTTPQCQSLIPLETVTLGFSPAAGTQGSLVPLDQASALVLTEGSIPGPAELVHPNTLQTLDPVLFRLTTEDGTEYVVHQKTGVQSIRDLNGNTVTFTANGIVHSAGKSVAFVRDGAGRITKMVDPAGNATLYGYDASGDLRAVTDREGNTTAFRYDEAHGLSDIVDPLGRRGLRNEYDDHGRLVSHTDAKGNQITYARDLNARQEIVTNRNGQVTVYEYDARGNVVRVTDPHGAVTAMVYDGRDNRLSVTNPLGETVQFTYDVHGNLTGEVDSLGNTSQITYNDRKQPLAITNSRGGITRKTYDARGNLASVTDPLGQVTRYTYEQRGLPLSRTDPLGGVTRYEYDGSGNRIRETAPNGRVTAHQYDLNGRRTSQSVTRTTQNGLEVMGTSFQYDKAGLLLGTTHPDGTVERTTYDAAGRRTSSIDRRGNQTRYLYDPVGRLIATRYADGLEEASTYDAEGRRLTTTDRGGRTLSHTYDAGGKLVKTVYPDGTESSVRHDAAGRVVGHTDRLGNATAMILDTAGRCIQLVDALGEATRFTYDSMGNKLSVTDARGNTIRFEYDGCGRRTRVLFPDGTDRRYVHDPCGRLASETDRSGHTTRFAYDAAGKLIQVIDALGQTASYSYDESGNRLSETTADGRTTRFAYDSMGRCVKRTLPLGMSESFVYDAVGKLAAHTDFNGRTTTCRYDSAGRLVESLPDPALGEAPVSFTYTRTGKRATMTDESGTTTYDYDDDGRLKRKGTPRGALDYAHDAMGNVLSMRSSNSGGVSARYGYDALGRLVTVSDERTGITRYTYDAVGNLESFVYPNGLKSSFSYDGSNRLTGVAIGAASALAGYAYELGPGGEHRSVTEIGGRVTSYAYDAAFRLTREAIVADPDTAGTGAIEYTYDPVGNRITRSSTLNGVASAEYAYDANQRLAGDVYDLNGNTLQSGASSYLYSFDNRLKDRDGTVKIVYDGDGNRVSRTVRGAVTEYLIDDRNPTGHPQVVEELAGGVVTRACVYGHRLISQRRPTGDGEVVRYYGYDGHGNVRFLADPDGSITDRYDYDSFGNLMRRSGATPNPYLYVGEEFDEELGLFYLRARYYRPDSGRFLTMDPFAGDVRTPLSLHKYLYAHSSPTRFVDPGGTMSLPQALVGLALSMVVLAVSFSATLALKERGKYAAGRELDEDQLLDLRDALRIVREGDPDTAAILATARFQVADVAPGFAETLGFFNVVLLDESFFKLSCRGDSDSTLEDSTEQAVTLYHESWHLRRPRAIRMLYFEHDAYYHEWVDKIRFGWTHDRYGEARPGGKQSAYWASSKTDCAEHAPELIKSTCRRRDAPSDECMHRLDW